MKLRRPSIPLSKWTIAVDLHETRSIQNQEGAAAYECNCFHCSEWKRNYKRIIPGDLTGQFTRVGIALDAPTDLYGTGEGKEERSIRVLFHIVGKILSGPDAFAHDQQLNEQIHHYEVLRESPYFSMRVLPDRQSWEPSPKLSNGTRDGVICIDIRLYYPVSLLA